MNFTEVFQHENIDFSGIEASYFLIGLLSAFDNRFQALADKVMKELTWKQFFAIICTNMCKEPPTIKELAEIMGSSHQNVKQILLKLEKKGFAEICEDAHDKRKQRVCLTEYCMKFCQANDNVAGAVMAQMFTGIPEEQLQTTIGTILQIEKNMLALKQ